MNMQFNQVLFLINFLNSTPDNEVSDSQIERLWGMIQELSIADRQELYQGWYTLPRTIYGRLSENNAEMGGYAYY